jgi:hypothetical protein
LACCHDQRGAGVGSGPVASLTHVEPSRCPAGDGSGDTSVALELAPATHVGGQRPAPTGRMPGESPATAMHRLELAPHVWRLRAETPGNEDVLEVHFVSMTVEDDSPTSFDYFSSPNSPNNFLGGLCFRPETRPPPRT